MCVYWYVEENIITYYIKKITFTSGENREPSTFPYSFKKEKIPLKPSNSFSFLGSWKKSQGEVDTLKIKRGTWKGAHLSETSIVQ